ncbi:uncharacterized protein [Primulina huaijiensis]|uniref:uncharacterized protein n=1 Tax=Primulina huaijiensis TaxID=1492673 RepID=UPI003CC7796E
MVFGHIPEVRPKEILKLMGVSNVTLRHVSSHLQKYREKKKRTGINCSTAQPHQFNLTNMDSRMKRQYQNGKPWDLHDLNSKKSPVAETMIQPTSQYVCRQHNTESSSVHYQIDMVKKLLDKAKGKQTNNYDDIEGYMKGGCNKKLMVGRSSMHGSNPNEGEANIFRHKEFSENISAMILNPDSAAANSEPYVPDICEHYLASNDCADILHHLNMDMGYILSEPNSSGFLEDIILSSQGLKN